MTRLRIFALLLVPIFIGTANAQETVPVELLDIGMLIRAEVNGRPVALLVDTGASFTHLDSKYLKLPRSKQKLRTVTGDGETELAALEPVILALAGRRFNIETLDVDLAALRKHCGCAVAGVLGMDVLRRFGSVTLDFAKQSLVLHGPDPAVTPSQKTAANYGVTGGQK